MNIIVKPVNNKKERKKLHAFTMALYKDNPNWIPPLWQEELNQFDPAKNPALEFCDTVTWAAWKNDRLAGTVTGIINHRFIEQWEQKHARFGWFECIEDEEVAHALLQTVEDWAAEKGMDAIVGPMGFSDFDKEGLLIEGFDEEGTFAMLYNQPYYRDFLEKRGHKKDADWLEFRIKVPDTIPDKVLRVQQLVLKRQKVTLLETKSRKDLIPYIPQIFRLLSRCYSHLYGYVTLTEKQVEVLAAQYISFIDHRLTRILLDEKGDVVGCGITMPSLSKGMRRAKGKLFPFGFIHILRGLKKADVLDMYLVAVHPDYQKSGLMAVLMSVVHQEAIRRGMKWAETLAELEDNHAVQTLWKSYEARQHKRRRVYKKVLTEE